MGPAWLERAEGWWRRPVGRHRIAVATRNRFPGKMWWPLPVTRGEALLVIVLGVPFALCVVLVAAVEPGTRTLAFWALGVLLFAAYGWYLREGTTSAWRFGYLTSVLWLGGATVGLVLGGLVRLALFLGA